MIQKPRIRAIMLDWAGTTVDHGSMAPVLALQTLFARHGITLSSRDARRDMGLLKRDHIHAILSMANIRYEWEARTGHLPQDSDTAALFEEFGPLQLQIISEHSKLIPGVVETVQQWQARGIRIGSSTGYTRSMLAPVLEQAIQGGYRPDASVCPDEARAGRPAPWMMMRNAELLGVYPLSQCVKIGDTVIDIEEGKNADMWTIGLTRTGNLIEMTEPEWQQLPESEKSKRLKEAETVLLRAGADYVVEDLHGCNAVLADIEQRLTNTSARRREYVSH